MNYKIWDKKEMIGKGTAEYVISEYDIKESDEVILILNDMGEVYEFWKLDVLRKLFNLSENLSANQIAEEYLKIKEQERIELEKEQLTLEEQANKIDILQAENADILLDSANKDIKMKTLEKDLADLTLQIAGGIQ